MTKQDPALSRVELLQGTLDPTVLPALRWRPNPGYGIEQLIRAQSRDVLQVETGSLYPALHRIEKQKHIIATWETSENTQRVRVYRLTPAGRKQLAAGRSRRRWLRSAARSCCIAGSSHVHDAMRSSAFAVHGILIFVVRVVTLSSLPSFVVPASL